jgi:predicted ribonuclease toxin of YeeF-YezG toxin-antitoxin module
MVRLFNAIVSFIMALAEIPPIKFSNTAKFEQFCDAKTLAEPLDVLTILLATDQDKATLLDQLKKLGENIKNYLDKLQTWQVLI